MNLQQAVDELEQMEATMKEINRLLEPMAQRDLGRRNEPMWCAHSMSGGLSNNIGRLRGWIIAGVREIA